MRKFINIIAFVLAFLIIGFMLVPTKTVNRDSKVYVEHEWDTLDTVVLGSPKMLTVPSIHKSILGYGYIVKNEAQMKKDAGKPIQQVNPALYSGILNQSDEIARELKGKNVNVQRLNPEVLDAAEIQYMKYVQQGNNFLFPNNSFVVIGNNVIECATRAPMNDKNRFIVRRILKPLTKDDPSIRYVAAPIPSPSFPEKTLYIEGNDILVDGNKVYVGHSNSNRGTSSAGVRWLQSVLGSNYKVYRIDINGFVHLDDVLTLIRPKLAVRVPSAITSEMPKPLANWDFIDVNPEDAKQYASSIIVVGPNRVLVDERFENLITELRNKEVDVTSVPFDDVVEMGGGLADFYVPLKRNYDHEMNSVKLNKEFFIEKGNEILETIKTFDYAEFFTNAQTLVTEKINTLMNK